MTDTVYLAGTGPHTFSSIGASHALAASGATDFNADTNFVTTALIIQNTSTVSLTKTITPLTEGWFHCEHQAETSTIGTALDAVLLYNNAGTPVIRVHRSTASLYTCDRWDGSAWQAVCTMARGGRHQIDIYWKTDASVGEIEFYYDKTSQGSFSGNTSALGSIWRAGFGNPDSSTTSSACVSQILITNFNTLNCKVHQRLFDATGVDQEWTGGLSDINEALPNTSTYIYTDTVDDISTYGNLSESFAGYLVKAVQPQWSGLRGGTDAPPSWRPVLKIDGTDYFGTEQDLTFGNSEFSEIFHENPATGLAWTRAAAGAAGRMMIRSSTSGTSSANLSLALPSGWQPNDIFLLAVESQNAGVVTAPDPSWTALITPVTGASQTRLTVFWKRATETETNPIIVLDLGDHNMVSLSAISGAIRTGNPWYDVQTTFDTAASTAITWPSVTPPAANYGIINILSRGTDLAVLPISAITMPHVDSTTQQSAGFASANADGGSVQYYFALSDSGVAIQSTGTMANTDHKALISAVLIPETAPTFEVGIQARA